MYKTLLVFCAISLSFSSIGASQEESDESGYDEEFESLRDECMEKFGVTEEDIVDILSSDDVTKIKPCYWGCYFTKMGLLNDKGQYDLDNFKTTMRKFTKNDAEYARLEKVGKKCEPVKDKAVSDGEAGCERGTLLAACFLKREYL